MLTTRNLRVSIGNVPFDKSHLHPLFHFQSVFLCILPFIDFILCRIPGVYRESSHPAPMLFAVSFSPEAFRFSGDIPLLF